MGAPRAVGIGEEGGGRGTCRRLWNVLWAGIQEKSLLWASGRWGRCRGRRVSVTPASKAPTPSLSPSPLAGALGADTCEQMCAGETPALGLGVLSRWKCSPG